MTVCLRNICVQQNCWFRGPLRTKLNLHGVSHQKHGEVVLIVIELLFLVDERVDEGFFVEFINDAHVRITWHVNSINLIVQFIALL